MSAGILLVMAAFVLPVVVKIVMMAENRLGKPPNVHVAGQKGREEVL